MERIDPRRAVDLAADALRSQILGGRWSIGEHLPAERELAARLGPSRPTLRAALARLEGEGLVRARHGSGVEVLDWRRTADLGLLPHLIARGDPALLEPFLALRRSLAAEAVARACTRASDRDLDRLQAEAERLAVERDTGRLFAGNLEFSRQVVELADNLPLLLMFNTVARILTERPELRARLSGNEDAVRASFPAIVALLRTRDARGVRERVSDVLEALDQAVLSREEEA